jgi:hypothetical protein
MKIGFGNSYIVPCNNKEQISLMSKINSEKTEVIPAENGMLVLTGQEAKDKKMFEQIFPKHDARVFYLNQYFIDNAVRLEKPNTKAMTE